MAAVLRKPSCPCARSPYMLGGARATGDPTADADPPLHAARGPRGRAPRRGRCAGVPPGADQQRHRSCLRPTSALYAALLTPQGKYLFDFLLHDRGESILLDVELQRLAGPGPAPDHVSAAVRGDAGGCELGPSGAGRVRPHRHPRRYHRETRPHASTRACPSWACGSCCRASEVGGFRRASMALHAGRPRRLRPPAPDAGRARRQPRSRGRPLAAAGERLRGAARRQLHQGLLRRPGAHRAHQASRPGQEAARCRCASTAPCPRPARRSRAAARMPARCAPASAISRWRCSGWSSWRDRAAPARRRCVSRRHLRAGCHVGSG